MRLRLRPQHLLALWTVGFAALLVWCVWTSAVAAEGTVAGPAITNAMPAATGRAQEMAQRLIGREFIENHRSELSFGLDQVEVLQPPLLGVPRWEYLASLIYIVLAFYASKILDWFIKSRLKTWAEKTATRWDDILVALADGPVKLVTFVVLFHIGLQVFDWPVWLEETLSRLALIGVAVALVLVSLRAIDFIIQFWREQPKAGGEKGFNDQFLLLVGKLLKSVLVVIAALTLLSNVGVNITALLGSVSVLGLALGLAAQDTVSNLFGTVAVFVDKPFKVGDRIQISGGVDGTVEEMGLRATRVRSLDGFLITVPNKAVGNNTVTNITARPTIRTVLNYGLTYDTPATRVRRATELLREIFRGHPLTKDFFVTFNRFDAFSLNIEVILITGTTDWKVYTAALEDLNLQVKERFDAERLEFAFPTQTVYLKADGGTRPA
jgi:MscS family membrane protein